jgi:hypothetical protein
MLPNNKDCVITNANYFYGLPDLNIYLEETFEESQIKNLISFEAVRIIKICYEKAMYIDAEFWRSMVK